ncbi:TetR/AcrR family transcriptional regulator, partial [Treponema lecithinolyticum]|uniref:TetR/AcrR family transcriptional regulator n=1 Tax=Treponema lecithinolyticum TaxID=53418 RepID=UPI0028ED490B
AKKVFLKKGYRYTTMEDIVSGIRLEKNEVYQYYKNTKTIMFDIMQSGNYLRFHRNEEIIKAGLQKNDDIYEIITQMLMGKLYEKNPERKLYMMFLAEVLYDKETEKLHAQLEKQAYELAVENLDMLKDRYPEMLVKVKRFFSNAAAKIYARIFFGMFVIRELFTDKSVFDNNRDEIHRFLYDTIKKLSS